MIPAQLKSIIVISKNIAPEQIKQQNIPSIKQYGQINQPINIMDKSAAVEVKNPHHDSDTRPSN